MSDEAPEVVAPALVVPEEARRKLKFWWFHLPDGAKFTHLDLTAKEALALEERFGLPWDYLAPIGTLAHGLAYLETFLARSDPDHAAERVAAMSLAELGVGQSLESGAAITVEWGRDDDLPAEFEDGLPKAGGGR